MKNSASSAPASTSSDDLFQRLNASGQLAFVNSTWCETLGYNAAEAAALRFIDLVAAEQHEQVGAKLKTLAETGEPARLEVQLQTKSGKLIAVEGFLSVAFQDGKPAGSHGLFRLTAEAAKSQHLPREKQFTELQSRFVSMASHELRTPLATLTLGVEFLNKYWTKLNEAQIQQNLQTVHAGVQQLRGVLDDIMVVGRSEEGRMARKPAVIEIVSFSRKLAEEVEARDLRRHPILWQCAQTTHEASVDPQLLRHILFNVLTNACKFSADKGSVQFQLQVQPKQLVFTVIDQGIGILEADQSKIYDLFFRGSNATKVPGSGLGLSVVQRCLATHGGSIHFESQPGRGTRFVVTIPV